MSNLQIMRFPRTKDRDMLYLASLRAKYKPPEYNPKTDGGWNPADGVFNSLVKQKKKTLRKLCKKHALNHKGPFRVLVKRMYLHWRASKLASQGVYVGNGEFIGYGKGYENVTIPHCVCGREVRKEKKRRELRWKSLKEDSKRWKKEALKPSIKRFPRYSKNRIHFPRL